MGTMRSVETLILGGVVAETLPAEFDLLIYRHCRFAESQDQLDPQTPMHELGVDSLEIVELIVDLEEQFGISFTDDLLTPQVFATPMTIWNAVNLLGGVRASAGSDAV
jgi:acyl carrier protein